MLAKGRVFVVMPFKKETEDLWEIGIRETCERLGLECIRADKLTEPGFLVAQMYKQIELADLIIGEMSERNPNVFYEIGYAHARGKVTLLLADRYEALSAFDTSGFRHQIHEGRVTRVREILEEVLPTCLPGGELLLRVAIS
jgi:nucleoside 2-deoxyribosyltransferase